MDRGNEIYNKTMNKLLNGFMMYSKRNVGRIFIAEGFIRTLNIKIYKYNYLKECIY